MSANEVLSTEEVGALLEGMADGVVATNSGVTVKGDVTDFEFKSSYNVSSYCPASLVNIYSRLARRLRAGLYGLLRREVSVQVESLRRHRYDEYIATLEKPLGIHSVGEKSLPGTALIVLDAALIYAFVEHYFGGAGEPIDPASKRDLAPTEVRMSARMLQMVIDTLTEAWSDVDTMNFVPHAFETDPALVTIAAPGESMLVAKLRVDLAGTPTECHIAMPLSMLAPVRAKLEASGQGSLSGREKFHRTMQRQLRNARVTLAGNFCEVGVTLRELINLAPGDVIPVDAPASVTLCVDAEPVLHGRFGTSRGMNAVRMAARISKDDQESNSNEAQQ